MTSSRHYSSWLSSTADRNWLLWSSNIILSELLKAWIETKYERKVNLQTGYENGQSELLLGKHKSVFLVESWTLRRKKTSILLLRMLLGRLIRRKKWHFYSKTGRMDVSNCTISQWLSPSRDRTEQRRARIKRRQNQSPNLVAEPF